MNGNTKEISIKKTGNKTGLRIIIFNLKYFQNPRAQDNTKQKDGFHG
jgi:hypothetical protein